ncbi:Arm DNA-binding domain-containing protein [Bacteroides thetaiotaomicron]|nr:Arm DNA-binding domain-containing protein [Bacteroides thetaiotaomicron]
MRSTFRLLFYINRQKIKKTGKCPVMGRITLDGKVSQYSTGEEVSPEYWDAGKGRAVVHGKDSEMTATLRELNWKLEELEEKAKAAYKRMWIRPDMSRPN